MRVTPRAHKFLMVLVFRGIPEAIVSETKSVDPGIKWVQGAYTEVWK